MVTAGSSKRKSRSDSEQQPAQHERLDKLSEQDCRAISPGWKKFAASILIIGHIWAVFGRPIEFATQGPTGPSPASSSFYEPVRGYSEFAYLNHGYAFFAPDPGPSHLIRVRFQPTENLPIEDKTGGGSGENGTDFIVTKEWTFPDLKEQWPRLLYHRHFMLSEFLHNTYQPRRIPEPIALDKAATERWNMGRARYEAVLGSITNHLRMKAGTDEIEIRRLEHQLVGLPEFLGGQRALDDPQLYRELLDEEAEAAANIPRFGAPQEAPILFGGQR